MKILQKDRNTTIFGILGFVSLLAEQISYLFDSVDATNPDYGMLVSALFVLLGFASAKDGGSAE